jgi:hypothetical protein
MYTCSIQQVLIVAYPISMCIYIYISYIYQSYTHPHHHHIPNAGSGPIVERMPEVHVETCMGMLPIELRKKVKNLFWVHVHNTFDASLEVECVEDTSVWFRNVGTCEVVQFKPIACVVFGVCEDREEYARLALMNFFLYRNSGLVKRSYNKAGVEQKMTALGFRIPQGGPSGTGPYLHTTRINNGKVVKEDWTGEKLQRVGGEVAYKEWLALRVFDISKDAMMKAAYSHKHQGGVWCVFIGTPLSKKTNTSNYHSHPHLDALDACEGWIMWYECVGKGHGVLGNMEELEGEVLWDAMCDVLGEQVRVPCGADQATDTSSEDSVETCFRLGDFGRFRIGGNRAVLLETAEVWHCTEAPVVKGEAQMIGTALLQQAPLLRKVSEDTNRHFVEVNAMACEKVRATKAARGHGK